MDAESKKKLKAKAHALKPVVMLGHAGLTEAVLAEIDIALNAHELIKIKIRSDKDERIAIGNTISDKTGADLVQLIGQIAVFYRMKPKSSGKIKAKPLRGMPSKLKRTSLPKHKAHKKDAPSKAYNHY
jgi:RNA-binding protein